MRSRETVVVSEDSGQVFVLGIVGDRGTFMRQAKDIEDTLEEEIEVKNRLRELGYLD